MDYQQKLLEKEKRKKRLIKAVVTIIAILASIFIITIILATVRNILRDKNDADFESKHKAQSYNFYAASDEDIFEDESYLKKDRLIHFTDSGMRTVLDEKTFGGYSPEVEFMHNIINIIINGDYETYNSYFIDTYQKTNSDDYRETFTMQRLYNIELEFLDSVEENSTAGRVYKTDFKLSYMIQRNNGTFRNDLAPDEEFYLPVVYRVMRTVNSRTGESEIIIYDLMLNSKYERLRETD